MKKLLVLILSFQLAWLPAIAGPESSTTSKKVVVNQVIHSINSIVETNPEFFDEQSTGIYGEPEENKLVSMQELEKLVMDLNDKSKSLAEIKAKMLDQIELEEQVKRVELKHLLKKMTPEQLDQIFEEAITKGYYQSSYRVQYENSYLAKEKSAVVLAMLSSDLARVKSTTLKRLGLLNRDQLVVELSKTQSLLNVKGKKWKTVLLVVLSIAVAGIVSWAVVSATKSRYEKKIKESNENLVTGEQELREEYANREDELVALFEERERLRNEGYIWDICSTHETVKSASCSFDYRTYSGTEICITKCLKNPTTGDSVLHTTSCTSAYIPNNCFQPNPYDSGYGKGFDEGEGDGYYDGYENSYENAYEDAYDDFYDLGYDDGYIDGYDDGYATGFTDGYSQAEFDSTSSTGTSKTNLEGYGKGYKEGYVQATRLLIAN